VLLGKPAWTAIHVAVLWSLSAACFAADLRWPPITNQTRPWTRWWWMGGTNSAADLTVEMEKYARAGLGGLEITPIYGVRGYEDRFLTYLSPAWTDLLVHALREGKRLGLGIDMATGNGWPFGGPWVGPEEASRYITSRTYVLKQDQRLSEPVRLIQDPILRAVAGKPDLTGLKDPISANANLQALAIDQVRFPKPLPLLVLMAYSDRGQSLDLTSLIGQNGTLDWVAPEGAWTLYALFQGWHGKMVERAGPGGEGWVIDHFSTASLRAHLAQFDKAFAGRDMASIRAYFNDSYEVDDASGEADWTPALFDEFRKRRGYDLRLHLPALFGNENADKNRRVLSDYRETISDLLLDRLTLPWSVWARSKGAITRNQAHGSPGNLLDLYAASGIPETEGSDVLSFKFASSAAHVTGKPLASAEAATWLGEHFQSTLGDVKRAVDVFFLGGINHICYHGTTFSPPGETWPGWMFYASVHFGPTNTFWNDFPVLNSYVTRVQSFLQSGRPSSDVLLYYPIYDAWGQPARGLLAHFNGGEEVGGVRASGQAMLSSGYTFDLISDRQLAGVKSVSGSLRAGGLSYRALVVPQTRFMPLETLQKLTELAGSGARIVVHGKLPADLPGWNNLEARRRAWKDLIGKARFLVGADLSQLLAGAGLRRERMVNQGLHFDRRTLADGRVYFVVNRGSTPIDAWVPLETTARSVGIFDPMRGEAGLAATRAAEGGAEVYLQLAPAESLILRTFNATVHAPALAYWKSSGEARELKDRWNVTFVDGGPLLPPRLEIAQLGSWTDYPGDEMKSFSGTAQYSTTFPRPVTDAAAWWLDLGRVAESARVRLNGADLGGLIDAPFRIVIPAAVLRESNTLEIAVSNLMANRIADLDRRGVNYKKFYNINFPARLASNRGPDGNFTAAKWPPRDSGLLGPVTLTPLSPAEPRPVGSGSAK
jgi:hypothetical protein